MLRSNSENDRKKIEIIVSMKTKFAKKDEKEINHLLDNLKYPKFYENNNYLHLGNNALKQLNVFKNNEDDSTCLFDIINFTKILTKC